MTTRLPHPRLIEHFCLCYGRSNKDDMLALYANAHLRWHDVPQEVIDSEPELNTARAFRVRAIFARSPEERAYAQYAESIIVHPYRVR